jgi:non-ribosomal peptide synthetase component F
MKERSHECPVCGFKLKGDRFAGYSCLRCHSHYSARFIAHLRRQHFKGLIAQHFTPVEPRTPVVEESEEFLIPQETVRQAIEEAKEAAGRTVQHLEDILDATSAAQESIDEVELATDTMPVVGRITGFIPSRAPSAKPALRTLQTRKRRAVPRKIVRKAASKSSRRAVTKRSRR